MSTEHVEKVINKILDSPSVVNRDNLRHNLDRFSTLEEEGDKVNSTSNSIQKT